MPRKRLNTEADVRGDSSPKRRRVDTGSLPGQAQPIKSEPSGQPLRRSTRLHQSSTTETFPISTVTPRKTARLGSTTQSTKLKTSIPKGKGSSKPILDDHRKTGSSQKRGRPKSKKRKAKDNEDEDIWTAMPYINPKEVYDFGIDFLVTPPKAVRLGEVIGPPPIIVNIHIVDKETRQEVPHDVDPGRYYWATARILHEDKSLCVEPEFVNASQKAVEPGSLFVEETPIEDAPTPASHPTPPAEPMRRWKTTATFAEITIPKTGNYRIQVALGVYIDRTYENQEGKMKIEKDCAELVSINSDVIIVQEKEPQEEDHAELLMKKAAWEQLCAERARFQKEIAIGEPEHEID